MNKRDCDNYRGFESTVVGTAQIVSLGKKDVGDAPHLLS